eukprot:GSMAST32.ASY1.ANO1.2084.1 assembled CDS
MEKATPEQQEAITKEIEKLKGEGIPEEDIRKQMNEKYPELAQFANAEGTPAATSTTGKKFIISGAPASGKGTQCAYIKDEFKCVHLSTGDMLRAAVKAETEVGLKAKVIMESGGLVDDEIIIKIILDRLNEDDCKTQGWLLDGFPRTAAQAEALATAGIVCDKFILLEVPDEALVKRVTGQIKDRLVQRSDDTPEKLKPRLENYHKNLDAILGKFTEKLLKVDGNKKPDEVWVDVKAGCS